jgi:putative ABC transport system permease protein
MIFSNAMNSVSLAGERLYSELGHHEDYARARNAAFQAAMIPLTNSLLAVGLVSLPGMMTGQILAGTSPLIAARYQIIVMCMVFSSGGISAALFLWLIHSRSLQQVEQSELDSCG